jgi:hypothetical protein
VLAGQTWNLLDERAPCAAGVVAEKPPHSQPYYHRPRTDRGIRPTCADTGYAPDSNRAHTQGTPPACPEHEPRYAPPRPRDAHPRSPGRTDAATDPKDHTNLIITLRRS